MTPVAVCFGAHVAHRLTEDMTWFSLQKGATLIWKGPWSRAGSLLTPVNVPIHFRTAQCFFLEIKFDKVRAVLCYQWSEDDWLKHLQMKFKYLWYVFSGAARWCSGQHRRLTAEGSRFNPRLGPVCVESACSPRVCVGSLRVLSGFSGFLPPSRNMLLG